MEIIRGVIQITKRLKKGDAREYDEDNRMDFHFHMKRKMNARERKEKEVRGKRELI